MVLVFVIVFSMLTSSLLSQVRQLTPKHSPGSTETRLGPNGFGNTLCGYHPLACAGLCAPQLRSYDFKARNPNPKTKTKLRNHVREGSPAQKANPHNLPPPTDMTGWCEVRSANKERQETQGAKAMKTRRVALVQQG